VAEWPYSTRKWAKLRALKLAINPLCEPCERRGGLVPASVVDHVLAIAAGGEPFPPLSGLMSMCSSCHAVKTNARDNPHSYGDGFKPAFKGCDLNGRPLDPDDPFLRGRGDQIAGPARLRTGGRSQKLS
jgi:5-methylcytosine-specific restriction endonuclease McrA